MKTVSEEQYEARLQICDECPERKDNSCVQCGCNLAIKARGRAFKCPLGKWNRANGELLVSEYNIYGRVLRYTVEK